MPLLNLGTYNTLKETDIWALSPTMQARPLHIKFSRSTGKLLRRIWATNSLDLILDLVLETWGATAGACTHQPSRLPRVCVQLLTLSMTLCRGFGPICAPIRNERSVLVRCT